MTLIMGVSGARGLVDQTMTPALVADLGRAFGAHVGGGRVVVGRDSRPSGEMLQHSAMEGLCAAGCPVTELGVVSTPGVALMVGRLGAAGGLVVTASHNPREWNGVKFLLPPGVAPPPGEAAAILDRYRSRRFASTFDRNGGVTSDETTHEHHVSAVLAAVDAEAIRRRRFRVVLDSVNGAGGTGGRRLLERLGCAVTHLNAEPTGRFAHAPEPLAENLTSLCDAVRAQGADGGFAQDPDADRLAIVDASGRCVGEEYTLVLAARRVLARRPGPVAANLSTSRMIDDVAAAAGGACRVVRTPVGEAHVAAAMRAEGCVVGGEGNGGVILPQVVLVRDSFAAMAVALELMAVEGRPLDRIVADIPAYAMVKRKFELEPPRIARWLERLRASAAGARVDDRDGVRLDWTEGWVHVRPSNTEPIARVIAEARDEAAAADLVRRATDLL
jgi:phosphomannomutase